jgi:hypothetical protein
MNHSEMVWLGSTIWYVMRAAGCVIATYVASRPNRLKVKVNLGKG